MIENKDEYLKKLTELLGECLTHDHQHAVLVIGDDHTRVMGLYAVNANTSQVGELITAAATYCIEDATNPERTVN